MKYLILKVLILVSAFNLLAEKYVNFYMKNGSFNGLYTSEYPLIHHDYSLQAASFVLNGIEYSIPMSDIDKIVLDDAILSENFQGDYRIYEKSFPNGNFKKVIVDNRASLLASKGGDFGANDTIFCASQYRNQKFIFYTDSKGRIAKMFSGKMMYSFIYSGDDLTDIVEYSADGRIINYFVSSQSKSKNSVDDITNSTTYSKQFNSHDFITDLAKGDFEKIIDNLDATKNLTQNYTELVNNPELHNQYLIVDGIILAKDLASFGASVAALVGTGGGAWLEFCESIGSLYNSFDELFQDMFPELEQMRLFTEYYKKKHCISTTVQKPSEITSTSATLRGGFSAKNGINGKLYFSFHKLLDNGKDEKISPIVQQLSSENALLTATVQNLQPHTDYFYYTVYECVVDGLTLRFNSEGVDFKTLTPLAETLGFENITAQSVNIKCNFLNVPANAKCGIQYGNNETSEVAVASPENGVQMVVLTNLEPETTYYYRSFIQYDGENYYGETLSFTTNSLSDNQDDSGILNYDFSIICTNSYNSNTVNFSHNITPILKTDIKFNIPLDVANNSFYIASCNDKEYQILVEDNHFIVKDLEWNIQSSDVNYKYDAATNTVSLILKTNINILKVGPSGERKILYVIYTGSSSSQSSFSSISDIKKINIPIILDIMPSREMTNISVRPNGPNNKLQMKGTINVKGLLAFYVCSQLIPGWSKYLFDVDSQFFVESKTENGVLIMTYRYENNYQYPECFEYELGYRPFDDAEHIGEYGNDEKGNPICIWRRYGNIKANNWISDKGKYFAFPYQEWHIKFHQDWLLNISGGDFYDPRELVVDSFEILDMPAQSL